MKNSKDLWSISTESNKMSLEVHQVPLKGLAQALKAVRLCEGFWSCCQPHQCDHTATRSTGPHDAIIVPIAFNNSNQYSLT